ncbi:MAG: T9SS type A sorting domain-containing protein [Prevotellaceae bacterium]|jgi:uncharacterized protein YbbC (DUF1343 family)|nr:T9SS type A sorting domain-containing protein [Prevotellaceae bacterium]
MRKFLFFVMLITCFNGYGQGNLVFSYDASGNCIRKYLTVVMSSPAKPDVDNEEVQPQTDLIGDLKVTVYPNPTDGLLQVVIDGTSEQDFRFTLLDMSGTVLQNFISHSLTNEIDMSTCIAGVYVLRLQIKEKLSVFRIIKK